MAQYSGARRGLRIAGILALAALLAYALAPSRGAAHSKLVRNQRSLPSVVALHGIHKIRHIVIVMQENRSFDNYFGTYPHADGIPGLAGHPGKVPCLPNPGGHCVKPFHDRYDSNLGGGYNTIISAADVDNGKMDGFIRQEHQWYKTRCHCGPSKPHNDVMGYHTGADIPNYWKYAHDFVLQDHMFSSVASWSLPSHLFLVSAWSARCTKHNAPSSCKNSPDAPGDTPNWGPHPTKKPPIYAWTDLTYLLSKHHVSWRYYMFKGNEPACESNATLPCRPSANGPKSFTIWYPLRWFDTVINDHQTKNVQSISNLFKAARKGKLPAVSWVVPSVPVSEHPPDTVSAGQTYVTGLINALMRSHEWNSTAIFLTWDDWGGFYDNVVPPTVDQNGYGIRAPGLVISPYAKKGYIDHQTLSFDAYLKFIEDDFLHSARLNPKTDGRPDPRPDVRENAQELGNLVKDFNFNQKPRKRVILSVHPKTDLIKPSASPFYGLNPSAWSWG